MANKKPFDASVLVGVTDLNDLTGIYDRSTSDVDVQNTTTETSLWSKSILASELDTTWSLDAYVEGDMLQNAGGNFSIRVKFGATTLWTGTTNIGLNATRHSWYMQFVLANDNAANVQRLRGCLRIGSTIGDTGMTGLSIDAAIEGTSAEDTTSAKTLDVTAQWSAASASLSWTKKYARLRID